MLDVPYSMVSVICNLAYVINSDLLHIRVRSSYLDKIEQRRYRIMISHFC